MAKFNTQSKFLGSLILLLTLFILVFVTKSQYSSLQENKDLKETYKNEMQEKNEELKNLNNIKMNLQNSGSGELDEINKYLISFNEEEILDFIYGNIRSLNTQDNTKIIIRNVSINPGSINEMGFTEGSINLNVNVGSFTTLKKLLNLINDEDNKYNLFISNLSVNYLSKPLIAGEEQSFDVSLPIKLLYKS